MVVVVINIECCM